MPTNVLSESLASSHHPVIPSSDLPLLLEDRGVHSPCQHFPYVRWTHEVLPRSPGQFIREESAGEKVELMNTQVPSSPFTVCFSCDSSSSPTSRHLHRLTEGMMCSLSPVRRPKANLDHEPNLGFRQSISFLHSERQPPPSQGPQKTPREISELLWCLF